jgi:hydrogenase maturation protease
MPRVLVIGYGNTSRGDDGFGPLAAQLIAGRKPPGVVVIAVRQLGPELAPEVSDADHVVFLDAELAEKPGALSATSVEPRDLPATTLSHNLEPGSLIALTRAVYGRAPTATLVTAGAADFEHGEEISGEVRRTTRTAADIIVRLADEGRLDTDALLAAFEAPA